MPKVKTILWSIYDFSIVIQKEKNNGIVGFGRRKFTPVGEGGSGLCYRGNLGYFVGLMLKLLFFHCTVIYVIEIV